MNYHVNEHIKNTVRVFPMQNRYGLHRYDMNENPEGLPKEFVDSVLQEITPEFLAIYPEPDRFLHKYAKFIGAEYENVLTTNGSDHGYPLSPGDLRRGGQGGRDCGSVL